LGSPGQNSTYLVQNIAGQQVGTLWGQTYQGVDAKGNPILSATSGKLGNGLPQVDLGWTNSFTYKHWDFNFFLRSTLGHSLVNSYRAFYEPVVSGQIVSYNRVNTKYFNPAITNPVFSSYYVEKANFLKLDNATLGYNFPMKPGSQVSRLRLYVAGNNLFVITNYTGVDPEARLIDYGDTGFQPGINSQAQGNVLAAGIDRRNSYFRTRTYTFGLNITF
jgi:iron complex outermembrane receptor protein